MSGCWRPSELAVWEWFADNGPMSSTENKAPPNLAPTLPDWDLYHALREQWTHEDNLVNHRLMWLILSQGLLFTAYGTLTVDKHRWLVIGFPVFGMAVALVIGISIFAALDASVAIEAAYQRAGLERLCHLVPQSATAHRGNWAAKALPFVFGTLWLLAATGYIQAN